MTDGQVEFDAGAPIQLILSKWKMLLVFLFFGVVAGVIWTQITKPIYATETVLLLPPASSGNPLLGIQGSPTVSTMLKGLVESRNAVSKISSKLKVKDGDINLKVEVRDPENQIKIIALHEKKDMSFKVCDEAVTALQAIRLEVNSQLGGTKAQYLEQAVAERETALAEAQRQLIEFQKKMKTTPDPAAPYSGVGVIQELKNVETDLKKLDQELNFKKEAYRKTAESALKLPTELPVEADRRKLEDLQYQLSVQEIEYGPRNPIIIRLKEQIKIARENLQKRISEYIQSLDAGLPSELVNLEARKRVLEWQRETLEELSKSAPEEAVQFAALQAEVDGQATLLKQARGLLEQAKFDGDVDRIVWSVLDKPHTSDKPINKSRTRNGAVGGFLGIILAVVFVVSGEVRKQKRIRRRSSAASGGE